MEAKQEQLSSILAAAPVIAVVVVDSVSGAVGLARALVAGGIPGIEITLRTAVAIDAIHAVAQEVEGAIVGAGTVLTSASLAAAERAGARFAVAPGGSPRLLDAADDSALPLLPGAATASESMTLLERGYRLQKFFPAEAAGGAALLRALASPLPAIRYCPTGGITADSAGSYLALPNVACVGGSWLAPAERVKTGEWTAITELARVAAGLRR